MTDGPTKTAPNDSVTPEEILEAATKKYLKDMGYKMKLKTFYVDVRFKVDNCEDQDDAEAVVVRALRWPHSYQIFLGEGKVVSVQEEESCQK